jgi:hypothetical protein
VLLLTNIDIIRINNSSQFNLFFSSRSDARKRIKWYEHALETRKMYIIAIDSCETFYLLIDMFSWLTFIDSLKKWVTNRIISEILSKQSKIKLNTVVSYLIDLRAYHVNWDFFIEICLLRSSNNSILVCC